MSILPNFLIVGAPKCGTTSIHNYLSQHPDILMSSIKEPKYFSSQIVEFPLKGKGDNLVEDQICKTWVDYQAIFSKFNKEKVIGESSADNLYYSKKVIPLIKETLGDEVKILIVLRDPRKRAFSAFMHMKRDLRENSKTFREALGKEESRIEENHEFIWHYKKTGLYYNNVLDFLQNFDNVKVILVEDLKEDSNKVISEICSFLDVDPSFEFSSKHFHNSSGTIKNKSLQRMLTSKSRLKRRLGKLIPKTLKEKVKAGNLEKASIPLEDKEYLTEFFKRDIADLEKLIDRNLSDWLK